MSVAKNIDAKQGTCQCFFIYIYIQSNLAIIKYFMYIIMTFLFVYTMIYIELN